MAKLDLNKTKSVCGGYGAIWEGWGRPGRGGGCPTTLGHAPMGLHLIHGPLGRIRWRSTWNRLTSGQWLDNCDRHREDMDMSLDPYAILLHPRSREYLNAPIWLLCDRGVRHKLVFFCSLNPACASHSPFRSWPWFLIKRRVHVSPQSKYDEHELRSELTCW
jgi:hypothetical protein